MNTKDQCVEMLFDQEPNYVKGEFYKYTFGEYPKYLLDYDKVKVKNTDEIINLIKNRGYNQFHSKDTFSERAASHRSYFINKKESSIICFTIQKKVEYSIETLVKIDPTDLIEDGDKEYDEHRFNAIFIATKNPTERDWFENLIKENKFIEDTKSKLFMLRTADYGSLELESFPINIKNFDIKCNYGRNFSKIHNTIIDNLENKNSGLYIFHGPPGTGKTSYIKYLTTIIETRRIILVPNTMVASLFSPKMIQNLYTFKNSILVLEDAEMCVFKRDGTNNELVSGILNITDGILKDLLNISIVVTFIYSKIDKLDKALLRKGRLKTMYKFDELSKEDSQVLIDKLKKKHTAKGTMSLADIYNIDDEVDLSEELSEDRISVGFGR